jgi:hypothetical protein
MATWITHLRVAELVHKRQRWLTLEDFLVGSIAPDSGVLNDDRKTYNPPTEVSHYDAARRGKWVCDDLRFYRDHMLTTAGRSLDRDEASFKMGY